ncbi:MAG: hypothetical protein AAF039_12695 [Bacteroidota bacterium]
MKIKISILILAMLTLTALEAQDNCSQYYPMQEGATFQYTSYNKKGKKEGVIDYTIKDVKNKGAITEATMEMKLTDKKGKVHPMEYGFTCEGDVVKIDFESIMPQEMLNQIGPDAEIKMDGTDIELPNNLSVGQELADANIDITMAMGPMNMKIGVRTINRKVEKEEKVNTPAGDFDCLVLYEDHLVKPPMGKEQSSPSRTWIAEGIGMIKQISYNKKGEVISTSELTDYSK